MPKPGCYHFEGGLEMHQALAFMLLDIEQWGDFETLFGEGCMQQIDELKDEHAR